MKPTRLDAPGRLLTLGLVSMLLPLSLAPPAVASSVPMSGAGGSLEVKVQLERTHVHIGDPAVHALVTIRGARAARGVERPVNLALVIDRSGSMSGQKIADARVAAAQMVDLLREGDRVAIVSYSDGVHANVPSVVIEGAADREGVKDAIRRIGSSGSTNLSGGLIEGHAQVRAHLDSDKVNRVILISDGLANRGVTAVPALNRIAREASQEGIVTSTLGLGADYHEDLMTAVADHGGGAYYFAAESSEIAGILAGEVSQMMATVARQGTLELTLPEGISIDEVFGYAWQQEGPTAIVRLGDVFAGQSRALLLRLRAPKKAGSFALGALGVAYQDMNASERRMASAELSVVVTRDAKRAEHTLDKEVAARIAEIELATSMQKAAALVQEGKYDQAKQELQSANTRARAQAKSLGSFGKELEESAGEADELLEGIAAPPASQAEQKKAVKRFKAGSYKLKKK